MSWDFMTPRESRMYDAWESTWRDGPEEYEEPEEEEEDED